MTYDFCEAETRCDYGPARGLSGSTGTIRGRCPLPSSTPFFPQREGCSKLPGSQGPKPYSLSLSLALSLSLSLALSLSLSLSLVRSSIEGKDPGTTA